jgi:signal transduction histidine kinase
MDRFPEDLPDQQLLPSVFNDELDVVNENFIVFCDRLKKSQSDLLKTKAQSFQNEKMSSLGILSAGIAHEVNNPLGGMLNCVKSMRENPEDVELTERYLPLLDKGLRQIETVMRQLLNFGRTEPLNSSNVDLRQLFEECIVLLSYKLSGIELTTDIAIERVYLLDAEACKQIIINIGLNAIQAMPAGGKLSISCYEYAGELVMLFRDSGSGIEQENIPHIFDPFFTTKDVGEGTGLGLAVTYSLVQRMNGRIIVESAIGQGTTFKILIPVSEPFASGAE